MNDERPMKGRSEGHRAGVTSERTEAGGSTPPAVVIRLDFESPRPQVIRDLDEERDWPRMRDWLIAHPELRRLVLDAVALEREAA